MLKILSRYFGNVYCSFSKLSSFIRRNETYRRIETNEKEEEIRNTTRNMEVILHLNRNSSQVVRPWSQVLGHVRDLTGVNSRVPSPLSRRDQLTTSDPSDGSFSSK